MSDAVPSTPIQTQFHVASTHKTGDSKTVNVLMEMPYKNARMKNIKIFSREEIASPNVAPLERKRRQFWNDKAEQLVSKSETSGLDKTTIRGIIDVSWRLRKTSLLEMETRNLLNNEKVISDVGQTKTGSQKRQTIPKNLERMERTHVQVESLDKEITEIRRMHEEAVSKTDKQKQRQRYNDKKVFLDGAYSELKKAQEALVKAIHVKQKEIEKCGHPESTVESSN